MSVDWTANFPLKLIKIKLQRFVSKLKHLHESDNHQNTQTCPACCTIPTAKVTDENNLEQPKPPVQCKAVDAYHEHQAQDTASRLRSGKNDAVFNTTESQQTGQGQYLFALIYPFLY
ncbi:hypothetical protein C0995_003865 [Termitomyces sp. Mi166|nr:hypothetical protein C0995_003865 [Termitomyces sp. Mi166\